MSRRDSANRSPACGVQRTMTRLLTALFIACGLVGIGAQSKDGVSPAPPAFDVVSVRPSAPPTGGPMFATIGSRPGGQWISQNVQFISILRAAYTSFPSPGQIVGGPDWIHTERFDINARAAGDPPAEVVTEMLKLLLADRFKLKVHTEQREIDVYALVLARPDGRLGPGLRKAAVDCEAREAARKRDLAAGLPATQASAPKPGERPECGMLSSSMNGVLRVATGSTPISAVVRQIQVNVGRPVIDRTGLTGRFDIELQFSATGPQTAADQPDAPTSVFTAVQEQLGLKLKSRKERMDVLVIDQVEMPTPN